MFALLDDDDKMMNWWRKDSKLIYKTKQFACKYNVFHSRFLFFPIRRSTFSFSIRFFAATVAFAYFAFQTKTRIIKIDTANFEFDYSAIVLYVILLYKMENLGQS